MDWNSTIEIFTEVFKGFDLEHFFEHFTFIRTIIEYLGNFFA